MKRAAALPMMIFVLAITSALAVSGAFVSRQMAANAASRDAGMSLDGVVEGGLTAAVAAWDTVSMLAMPVGSSVHFATDAAGPAHVDVWATRLSAMCYWLVGEARLSSRPRLSRRLGVVVRLTNGAPALVPERAWGELP